MSAHRSRRAHAPHSTAPLGPEEPAWWLWLFPTTRLGRWSLRLFAAFFGCFVGFRAIQILGDPLGGGKKTFWDRPTFALLATAAAVFGGAAGLSALAAMIFRRERALLVALTALVGLLVLGFAVGELVGHE